MKNFKKILIAIISVVSIAAVSTPEANAQFRFGVKAGINIDKMSMSKEDFGANFSSDNRTGWRAGVMTEFTVPIIGIGLDASLLYVHRSKDFSVANTNLDYLELPLNLKYKFSLPVVSNIVTPFLTTGPSFGFKLNKSEIENFKNKNFDVAWNLGLGVELVKHLQVAAGYSWSMNKAYQIVANGETHDIGRLNGWVITAAYLF